MGQRVIIDSDSHFVEPPDLWRKRLPASWGDDRVMHIEWSDELQSEVWCVGNKVVTRAWQFLTHNWGEEWNSEDYVKGPKRFADADPANWELDARIAEMDKYDIQMQVLYPNIGGFFYDPWVQNPDEELSLAHMQVYNDYLLEWSEAAPNRFIPLATLPYWNLEQAIKELHRIADTHHGVVISGAPQLHGCPYLGDKHWTPLWDAIDEAGLPISFHVANGGVDEMIAPQRMAVDGARAGHVRASTSSFLANADITNDLLMSGVLARHPTLRFVIVESGLGWVPFVVEACDYHFKVDEVWKERPEFDCLPSELFRRQVYVNYWFEHLEPLHLAAAGEDNVLFETDFPHPTHIWGEALERALEFGLTDVTAAQKEKVLWRNAAALYGLSKEVVADLEAKQQLVSASS